MFELVSNSTRHMFELVSNLTTDYQTPMSRPNLAEKGLENPDRDGLRSGLSEPFSAKFDRYGLGSGFSEPFSAKFDRDGLGLYIYIYRGAAPI